MKRPETRYPGTLSDTDRDRDMGLPEGSMSHEPGTQADARTAFVYGDSATLPVSWVRGKSAGDRHPLRQVLILFYLGRRTSIVFSDGAICRIAGRTRTICL